MMLSSTLNINTQIEISIYFAISISGIGIGWIYYKWLMFDQNIVKYKPRRENWKVFNNQFACNVSILKINDIFFLADLYLQSLILFLQLDQTFRQAGS